MHSSIPQLDIAVLWLPCPMYVDSFGADVATGTGLAPAARPRAGPFARAPSQKHLTSCIALSALCWHVSLPFFRMFRMCPELCQPLTVSVLEDANILQAASRTLLPALGCKSSCHTDRVGEPRENPAPPTSRSALR